MMTRGSQTLYAHADAGHGAPNIPVTGAAAGVEAEDMDTGGILRAVFAVGALVVVIVISVFQIVNLEVQDVRAASAMNASDQGLTDLRLAATQKLNRYEPIAGEEGKYRIPIERAMQLMAAETVASQRADYSSEVVLRRE